MKKAYSYIRWSQKSQGESGRDSRERQTKSADTWIAEHSKGEYALSKEVFVDSGKSASKGKNIEKDAYGRAKGELMRFIQLVEDEKISKGSILLIDEYSRFSRLDPAQSLALFSGVISSGIGLVFTSSHEKRVINGELLAKEPHILYFIIGEMIRSYTETAERSRKIISAKRQKKSIMESGVIVAHNNIPKYFSYVPITKETGKYIHNENTEIVRALIKGILAGKSLYWLANDLNARKIATFRKGYQWSGNSVRQILRNTTLKGEYLGNESYVEPITDSETFDRIQHILNGNKKHRGQSSEYVNVFRGICFCAKCNHAMTIQTQKIKGFEYRYLRCSLGGNGKDGGCPNRKHVKLDPMEKSFFWHFLGQHPYEIINSDDKAELEEVNKQKILCQIKIDKNKANIITTLDLIGSGVTGDEIRIKLNALNKEGEAFKNEMDSLNSRGAMIQAAPENFRKIMGKTINFGAGEKGEDIETPIYEFDADKLDTALRDKAAREQVRMMLPSLIGKITVDTNEGRYYVYTHGGKMIHKSVQIVSSRNNSAAWKKVSKDLDETKDGWRQSYRLQAKPKEC